MKSFFVLTICILFSLNSWAKKPRHFVDYYFPIYSGQVSEAEDICNDMGEEIEKDILNLESLLPEKDMIRVYTKLLVNKMGFYIPPGGWMYCHFYMITKTSKVNLSVEKSKDDYWLKKKELKDGTYCDDKVEALEKDPRNIGLYKYLNASLLQGEFCSVRSVKVHIEGQ